MPESAGDQGVHEREHRVGEAVGDLAAAGAVVEDEEQVDEFYEAALAAGGTDNGPPGPRPHYHAGYYGAFVLDPDGHNLEAVHHTFAG